VSKPSTEFQVSSVSSKISTALRYDAKNFQVKGLAVINKDIVVNCTRESMCIYIPEYESFKLSLDLSVEHGRDGFGKVGTCSIPIGGCFLDGSGWVQTIVQDTVSSEKEFWLPFDLNARNTLRDDTSVLVRVEVAKPIQRSTKSCPYSMPKTNVSDLFFIEEGDADDGNSFLMYLISSVVIHFR